jgi:hypothetical protein
MLLAACYVYTPNYVKITNKSEYNITWVVIVDTDGGKIVTNEKDDELIAKNGGSKTFNVGEDIYDFIACVEAEDTLEPICTIALDFAGTGGDKSITWNGHNGSGWLPAAIFPNCPKIFAQCNSEAKDE